MKNFSLLVFTAIVFFACKNSEQKTEEENFAKITKNCLTDLDYNYEQLLSLNEVSAVLTLDDTKVKTNSIDRKDQYGNVYYSWKSDRPDMESPISVHFLVPDNNSVGISGLNSYSEDLSSESVLANFEIEYKQLSDSELKELDKNTQQHTENKTAEEKETLKGIVEARKNFSYKKIENFGRSSFWRFSEKNGGELVTLIGNEKFSIYIKISYDADENLEMAKKLAKTVMDKCL
ncbi:MAG TPA: hypothetical protein VKY33_02685 [Flavobacterium sp.]|nr:hypothetical protein [Flavobacterium sp.]